MSGHLRVVAFEPRSVFAAQEQNVHLLTNTVMEAAGQMMIVRQARKDGDLDRMASANDLLGIQLRAAERLRDEIADAIEARRGATSR